MALRPLGRSGIRDGGGESETLIGKRPARTGKCPDVPTLEKPARASA